MATNPKATTNASEVKKEIEDRLRNYRKELKFQLFRALTILEAEILQNIRVKSGLHVRSGALLNSISASKKITDNGDGTLTGEIGPQGIPYAAIHEFGGVTKAHDIFPRNAKALKFQIGNQAVFAKAVHHPGSRIPERSYLRRAMDAKQQEIFEAFGLFLIASFRK